MKRRDVKHGQWYTIDHSVYYATSDDTNMHGDYIDYVYFPGKICGTKVYRSPSDDVSLCHVPHWLVKTPPPTTHRIYRSEKEGVLTIDLNLLHPDLQECLREARGTWDVSQMQKEAHAVARANGWWEDERNDGECLALTHSEISEALEALRNKEGPERVAEELADVVLRVLDFCQARNLNLSDALKKKHERNKGRGYKHGGKGF